MKLPQELAKQSTDKFLDVFKNLYEHSPWFVEQSIERVLTDEKYNNLETFHELLCEIMLASDNDMQNNLITAHPMLAGKKAQNNELTDFSTTGFSFSNLETSILYLFNRVLKSSVVLQL